MELTKEDFQGTERFAIQRRLGAGGCGVVYQAYDRIKDEVVALKILQSWHAESLYELKQEFRSLTDITHVNLISLYELMVEEEQWFFTMELVNGVTFLDYILDSKELTQNDLDDTIKDSLKTDGKRPPSIVVSSQRKGNIVLNQVRLRAVLQQLVEGLTALHRVNKIHRDIKPSNVMVTTTGQVKILDFGLVKDFAPSQFSEAASIVGTPAYMSPEQAAGKLVVPATDWYSVGVMLYQALTGRLPYSGSIENILINKQRYEPLMPKQLVPQVPNDLNDLCVDLMHRLPQARPDGQAILARLTSGRLAPEISVNTDNVATKRSLAPSEIPFTGREQEMTALKEAFLEVKKEAKAISVLVHGSSGMGKSALVRHFLEELQISERQVVVLAGRCYQQESVPYKAFDSVIDALSQYLKHLSLQQLKFTIPNGVLALARLFPVLQQVEEVVEASRVVLNVHDSQELRRRAFEALKEWLKILAQTAPLVIFIDDLQWGDIDSVSLLNELLRPNTAPPILLVATYRREERETSPLLRTLLPLVDQGALGNVKQLAIGEFNEMETYQLIQSILVQNLPSTTKTGKLRLASIIKESGGSPFFITELARYAEDDQDSSAKIALTLNSVLKSRVLKLPEPARKFLEIVAVAGQPIKFDIAKQLLQVNVKEHAIVSLLRTNHLIRIRDTEFQEEIEPYHDRIRETIIDYLHPETLKDYHYGLALALEAEEATDPERLISHFHKAAEHQKAFQYAVQAANQANQTLAFDHAVQLYNLALDFSTKEGVKVTTAELSELQLKLAEVLASAGRGAQAAEVYLKVANSNQVPNVLDLRRRAAEQLLISGHIDEGTAVLRDVLSMIGMRLAKTRNQALISLLYRRLKLKFRGLKFTPREVKDIAPQDLLRIDACWSVALGLSVVDTIRGADFQAEHLLLALKAGEPYRIARALSFEAAHISSGGGKARTHTEALLEMGKILAEGVGNPHAIGLIIFINGFAAFMQGRWQAAYQFDKQAEDLLREECASARWELASLQVNLFHNLLFLGDFKEIARQLPVRLSDAQNRGDLYAEMVLRARITYMLKLVLGDPEQAQQELEHVLAVWSRKEFYQQHFWVLIGRIEVALYQGNATKAWELVTNNQTVVKKSLVLRAELLRILWFYVCGRSALAHSAKSRDSKGLVQSAADYARKIEQDNRPWSNPLAQLLRAGIALKQAQQPQAIELLRQAAEKFTLADMKLYAAATQRGCGQLLDNREGAAMIAQADEFMVCHQVKEPNNLVRMILPPMHWL